MNFLKNKNGYSLVEALVAIAVLLLALVGPITIASKGIQSSYYAKEQATAVFLAQEGIEAFISMRNDAAIAAVADGDLSKSWDWVSSVDASCFSSNGCNVDFSSNNPLSTIQSCVNEEDCRLHYDPSDIRAKYSLSSAGGSPSPYIRKIFLTYDSAPGNNGIVIKSTVSWNARLFKGDSQNVTLYSSVFNLYE